MAKHLPAADLGKIVLTDFEQYKEHLERDFVMKKELKKVRLEVNEDDELRVLHVDWAEQHKVTEIKEVQSAYFNGRFSYDLHTGYCYSKEDSRGFVSLSDSSDHKAGARVRKKQTNSEQQDCSSGNFPNKTRKLRL